MSKTIQCPKCDFKIAVGSLAVCTTACPNCETRITVNESAVAAKNKMALLAELPSCLAVGWPAECRSKVLTVHGRIQYRYESGLWDEWHVQFTDHSWAWITQDEGRYILQTEIDDADIDIERLKTLDAGDDFAIGNQELQVKEIGFATMVGMQGRLPFLVEPDEIMHFIELSGHDRLVSVEIFRDGSYLVFEGDYLKPDELKPVHGDESHRKDRLTESPFRKIYSPPVFDNVDHPVQLADEDVRPKVAECPSCKSEINQIHNDSAILVCNSCRTGYDLSLPKGPKWLFKNDNRLIQLPINVGDSCVFNDREYVVGGRVLYRQNASDGVYDWTACQLLPVNSGDPLFLENEDDHWTLFGPPSSKISHSLRTLRSINTVKCGGKSFSIAEQGECEIVAIDGELTWVARVGDKLKFTDAVKVPHVLSAEWTTNEIEWSEGTYLDREDVADAFDQPASKFPKPRHYLVHQPFRSTINHKLCFWASIAFAAFMASMGFWANSKKGELVFKDRVSHEEYLSGPGYLSEPFEIPAGQHACRFDVYSPGINNQWVDMSFLVLDNEEKVLLDEDAIVERYTGSGWSEGKGATYQLLRLTGPKTYRLNLFADAGKWSQSGGDVTTTASGPQLTIGLRRGIRPAKGWVIGGLLALVYPLLRMVRWMLFNSAKTDWLTPDYEDDYE